MKVSHKWLQTYFKKDLPETSELARILTFGAFEIESVENKTDDNLIDVKVLPDRACYALSHLGIAKEISAFVDCEFSPRNFEIFGGGNDVEKIDVVIEAKDACDFYGATRIIGLEGSYSPEWLKNRLQSIGQKSINLLVDISNFILFDIGAPTHVFDGDKVKGKITVRFAKEGEKITTLDGKDIILTKDVPVIADDEGALAIAGVKGGKKAEVTRHTKHIILESAHFDAKIVRKVSRGFQIITDSSKRFENDSSKTLPVFASDYFISILKEVEKGIMIGERSEAGNINKEEKRLEVDPQKINSILGVEIDKDKMAHLLSKAFIPSRVEGEKLVVFVPEDRKDLSIVNDVAEEVGRLFGYEKIKAELPKIIIKKEINKSLYWKNIIRRFLVEKHFSEVSTYSLVSKGEIEIESPLSPDKKFYRDNLSSSFEEKLNFNLYYSDLLGLDKIRIFEFGHVYKNKREYTSFAIGIAHKKIKKDESPNEEIKIIRDEIFNLLKTNINVLCTIDDTGGIINLNGKPIGKSNEKDGIMELDFDLIVESLPEPIEDVDLVFPKGSIYKPMSEYPFISRDIAVFIPGGKGRSEELIRKIKISATELLVSYNLFDVFEKKNKETGEVEKTSYGYRLVFQSNYKTLTDEEINRIMENITRELTRESGWEVR